MLNMNPATAGGVPYRVPPEPSRLPSLGLAALVHAGLLFFLWAGISWQNTDPVAVEAEVWDMNVQAAAAPPEPQPEPVRAPEPVERVAPPPEEEVAAPKAPDIALERIKEQKQKKLEAKLLAEEKLLKEKKLADEKARELADKKAKEKAEKLALEKKEAAEQKAFDKLRADVMKRVNGATGTSGTAEKSTAPRFDAGYVAAIASKVHASTIYNGERDVPGNPRAAFEVKQLPTGEIMSVRLVKSSGIAAFDEAVERGIYKSSPLPKKKDGTVERELDLGIALKDVK